MKKPLVGIVMGRNSDWYIMQQATVQLRDFSVPYETHVISAHRTSDIALEYAQTAIDRGLRCIIAGAGGRCPPCRSTGGQNNLANSGSTGTFQVS